MRVVRIRHGSWIIAAAVVALCAGEARAGDSGGNKSSKRSAKAVKKPGTVLTFYGLRKIEQDPKISDEEKLKEWQAFIVRAKDQIEYAEKAIVRWKNASKIRVIEAAQAADRDVKVPARDKAAKWREVAELYARSREGARAKKRAAYWHAEETKRLAEAAEDVEKARKPKVERIQAWASILDWTTRGPEARAASKRIDDLQRQLFAEAQSVDKIRRVDKRTKLEAWRDVLRGRPTTQQKKVASSRVAKLESELGKSASAVGSGSKD